jgi:hypothetical protein
MGIGLFLDHSCSMSSQLKSHATAGKRRVNDQKVSKKDIET